MKKIIFLAAFVLFLAPTAHAAVYVSGATEIFHLNSTSTEAINGYPRCFAYDNGCDGSGHFVSSTGALGDAMDVADNHYAKFDPDPATSTKFISFWVKFANLQNHDQFLFEQNVGSGYVGEIWIDSSHITYYDNGAMHAWNYGVPSNNVWHMYSFVRSGTTVDLYVDGQYDSSITSTDWFPDGVQQTASGGQNHGTIYDEFVFSTAAQTAGTIAALYNSGTGEEACATVGCGGSSPSSPSLTILYPTLNGTTTAFTGFKYKLENLNTTIAPYSMLKFIYGTNASSVYNFSISSEGNIINWPQLMQTSMSGYKDFLSERSFIPTAQNFKPFPTGTFYVKAFLYVSSTSFLSGRVSDGDLYLQSATSSFTIVEGALNNNLPEDLGKTPVSQIGIALMDCSAYEGSFIFSTATLKGLWCELVNTGVSLANFFITPNSDIQDMLSNTYHNFQASFPFNIVYGMINDISEAVSSTPKSSFDLYLAMPAAAGGKNFAILTSSSLETAVGSSTKNFIFGIESHLLWIGAMILMIMVVL